MWIPLTFCEVSSHFPAVVLLIKTPHIVSVYVSLPFAHLMLGCFAWEWAVSPLRPTPEERGEGRGPQRNIRLKVTL